VLAKPAVPVRPPLGFLLTALSAAAATLAIAAQASCVASARQRAGSEEPAWLEPAASAVVAQPAVFRWAAVPGADRYRLRVGSAPGADDLLNVQGIPATSTSYRFPGELPALKPLYARVSALRDGTWRHAEVQFAADHVAAEWVYPLPGSAEVMPGRAFAWTPVAGSTGYRVEIGTAPGLSDVLDRTLQGPTSLAVADLPRGRRLVARLSTHVQDGWYARDNVFAVALGYRGAEPLHPRPGGMASPGRPFTWQPVPLATGYRLRIGATPGSSALFDSGVLGVSTTFVPELPTERTLFATLTTAFTDRTLERAFEFRAEPGTTDENGFVEAALAATVEVREMFGARGAWPNTLLDAVVKEQRVAGAGCVELARALLCALAQQRNGLQARLLNTCLLGNYYDCHTLVELHLPRSDRWMLLDPTFAVTARRDDGGWATAADISQAVRQEHWTGISFVPLSAESLGWLHGYYIDYPLLFVSPFGEDRPHADGGPPILRYYERVPLPLHKPGAYAVRCSSTTTETEVRLDGHAAVLTCQGRDALSEIRSASSIEAPDNTVEVYRPRRFLF
jgi:hypothetical protein